MSRLQDYLSMRDVSEDTKEIKVNDREFTIKPITEPQLQGYRARSKAGKKGDSIDASKLNNLIITNHVIDPNFSDADFLAQVNCATATEFIGRKFTAGMVAKLVSKIMDASDFEDDINEDIEEAQD